MKQLLATSIPVLPRFTLGAALTLAAGTRADVLYVVSNTTNQVFVMNVPQSGTPSLLTTINSAQSLRPYGLAMRANGDLLVNQRGPCTNCVGGGLTRFPATTCGAPFDAEATATANLRNPHDAVVTGDIAYMIDTFNNRIARYSLQASGAPVEIGSTTAGIPSGGGRGVVVHPGLGELFLSDCCVSQNIRRFRIEADGSLSPAGVISGNNMVQPHGLMVSLDGELFVCNATGDGGVSRFRFDAGGNAIANGRITGNGTNTPISTTITSWGEMLVVSHAAPLVSRFTFDGAGNPVANGTFAIPANGGDSMIEGTQPAMVVSPPVASSCVGQSTTFTIVGTESAAFTYQWRRDGAPIDPGTNPTAATRSLTLTNVTHADAGAYDCVVTTGCGISLSGEAPYVVCACLECAADFNEDGGIDGSDVSAFFDRWEGGHCDADVNADGGVDGADVSTFFSQWENGGC